MVRSVEIPQEKDEPSYLQMLRYYQEIQNEVEILRPVVEKANDFLKY